MIRPSRIAQAGSLPRALAEIAVVVVGVLIALAAESWWADRQEARIELEYLVQLEEDVGALVAEIEASVAEETRILEQLQEAAQELVQGDPDLPFGAPFTTSVPNLRNGGLAQVDAMRGPRLARDPALRAQISNLATSVSTSDRLLSGFFEDVVDNLRVALVEIARIQQAKGPRTTNGHVRTNPQVLTAVTFHGIALQNRITTLQGLLDEAEAAGARLRQVLGAEGVPGPSSPPGEPAPTDSTEGPADPPSRGEGDGSGVGDAPASPTVADSTSLGSGSPD